MPGPLWQQLLDFLRLQETLDAIAAGNTQANVDIEALRASLETAARDVPAIRAALDFVKAVSETPGTEVVGGVNIFRSAAFARGARGADLERVAESLRKRVFEGKESLDAVRREAGQAVVQEVKAQVAEKLDLFGPEFVAIVRGAAVGTGAAILAQAMPEERPLGVSEATWRERVRQPFFGAELDREKFEAAYQDFESWRKDVRAWVYREVPPGVPSEPSIPLVPQLGPQPESPGVGVKRLAQTIESLWQAENPGVPLTAKLRYKTDPKGNQILENGKPVLDRDKNGALVWDGDGASFLNSLATFAAHSDAGNAAEVQAFLTDLGKAYETGSFEARRTGRLLRDSLAVVRQAVAFPPTVEKVWSFWNDSLTQIDDKFRQTRSYNADILDENIATFEQVTGKSADKDVQRILGLADDGMIGVPITVDSRYKSRPEVKAGVHYLGMRFTDELDPDEVVYGNTLTRTEIVNQMYDIWRTTDTYAIKKELSDTSGGFSPGRAASLTDVHMFENRRGAEKARDEARAFKWTPEYEAGWQPPSPHGPPQGVSSWLSTRARQGLTRADEERRIKEAEGALEMARQRKAEEDVLAYGKTLPEGPDRDFVLANVAPLADKWRKAGNKLEATVQHFQTLDKTEQAAATRKVEREKATAYAAGVKRAQDVLAYAETLPAGSQKRKWAFDHIKDLANAVEKSGVVQKTIDDAWDLEQRVRDEEKRLGRVTWDDLGRLPEQERPLAVYGFYKRDAKGNIVKDADAIAALSRRSGEHQGDWIERVKKEAGARFQDQPPIPGATEKYLKDAGIVVVHEDRDKISMENQLVAELYRSGALGAKPLSAQDTDLFSDYRTMVEFQAQQVAPAQQEAYRQAAYDKWPQIIATIDARLGVPKAKGNAAEILAEETYRKQQAAEMIRQTDVPAMVGVRKVSTYDTREEIRKGSAKAAELPETPSGAYEWPNKKQLEQAQERAMTAKGELERIMATPAVQRVIAGEAALREGADPQAVTSAIAWEAQQAAARFQIQYAAEQKLAQERYSAEQDEMRRRKGLPTLAEEQERQIVKPQPFRPTFWRFGPSFGRR